MRDVSSAIISYRNMLPLQHIWSPGTQPSLQAFFPSSSNSSPFLNVLRSITKKHAGNCRGTRHTSHVTRHTSHVTRHTPHATRHTVMLMYVQMLVRRGCSSVAAVNDLSQSKYV